MPFSILVDAAPCLYIIWILNEQLNMPIYIIICHRTYLRMGVHICQEYLTWSSSVEASDVSDNNASSRLTIDFKNNAMHERNIKSRLVKYNTYRYYIFYMYVSC